MRMLYAEGFVQDDTLRWGAAEGELHLAGEIACLGNIKIQVVKHLGPVPEIAEDEVQTVDYRYTAVVSGFGRIMQIDANHSRDGHEDNHHRHEFDWKTDKEVPGSPFWVGRLKWQTLAEFIRDVAKWYWENRVHLPHPDKTPEPEPPVEVRGVPGFTVVDLEF